MAPSSLSFANGSQQKLRSRQEHVLELPLTGATSQKVTSLAFNPKQRGLLGVGPWLRWEEWLNDLLGSSFFATLMDRCWKWCSIPVGVSTSNKESLAFWRVLHLAFVLYQVLTWCYHPKHRGDCILGTDHIHIFLLNLYLGPSQGVF